MEMCAKQGVGGGLQCTMRRWEMSLAWVCLGQNFGVCISTYIHIWAFSSHLVSSFLTMLSVVSSVEVRLSSRLPTTQLGDLVNSILQLEVQPGVPRVRTSRRAEPANP